MDMLIKTQIRAELNTNTASVILNIQALRLI